MDKTPFARSSEELTKIGFSEERKLVSLLFFNVRCGEAAKEIDMLATVFRVVGILLILVGSFVINTDIRVMTEGKPESTVLGALIFMGQFSGESPWMAVVAWILPVVMGVVLLITPREISTSYLRRRR